MNKDLKKIIANFMKYPKNKKNYLDLLDVLDKNKRDKEKEIINSFIKNNYDNSNSNL